MSRSTSSASAQQLVLALFIALIAFGATAILMRATQPVPVGVIQARLVNPDGDPARCNATLWEVMEDGGRRISADASARCDREGVLRWSGRAAGKYRIIASVENCVQLDRELELGAEVGTDLGDLAQAWGGNVIGRVTEDGQPADKVEVRTSTGRSVITRPDGSFKLDGLPIGDVELRSARGFSGGGAKAVVTRGGRAEVEIALAPVAPRGVVGLSVMPKDGAIHVLKVAPGSPAEGKVQAGDLLVAVDGRALGGDIELARKSLAGEPGSAVRLELSRGGAPLVIELSRMSAQALAQDLSTQ